MTVQCRLVELRKEMHQRGLDACLVPSADPHHSEYLAEHWQARRWLSGFTGTAGTLVVTANDAGLWTDGRYFIQAEEQLAGSGIRLFKLDHDDVPSWPEWLGQMLPLQGRVGFDGRTVTVKEANAMLAQGLLLDTREDLLDGIWLGRPTLPDTSAFDHDVMYAGLGVADKLAQLRREMACRGVDYQLLCSLDDIAWLFNIRGTDIDYSPVVHAYALIGAGDVWLFIDANKVPDALRQRFRDDGIQLGCYNGCADVLSRLEEGKVLWLDPGIVNIQLFNQVPDGVTVQRGAELTTAMKAVKNPIELQHFRDCLRLDGAAMVRFMCWLDQQVPAGEVTELSAEAFLEAERQAIPGYQGPSFRTIAGYKEHGAKMHYAADEHCNYQVGSESFFLVDSGGHYLNGTTDITRTFHFGPLSQQQRVDYTLVLKAHIALSRARFRKGCRGTQIDALARAPLWEQGIDYGCGTGHGVGFCLNVHEGPHSLSQKWIDEPLELGMTVTVEPGIYREGEYGIRIENILAVVEDQTTAFGTFYRFETLTLAPICTAALLPELLSEQELAWLNDYHGEVYRALAPLLTPDEREWLAAKTAPVDVA